MNALTDTFQFQSFPKPVKKNKKHGWNSTIPVQHRKKRTKAIVGQREGNRRVRRVRLQSIKTIKLPSEKSRSQLIKELDSILSKIVLFDGVCKRCGKHHRKNEKGKWLNATCSHYWPRDYYSTRWDLDNLDDLCWLPCHSQKWEHDKQGAYKDYMIKKLGKKGFDKLEIKARSITKFTRDDIKLMIIKYNNVYKKLLNK